MSSRSQASGRRRRKTFTYVWMGLLSLGVIALIYWEQTALLYILATLGVTALLVVVALADLSGEKASDDATPPDESIKAKSTFGSVSSSAR
ncbi:MAG TPA: hypothetical protein VE135_28170 [Pyrinomonadaceae bacterium]|nr:hypothetical protein [Pyrinomonadaceae bacterium]